VMNAESGAVELDAGGRATVVYTVRPNVLGGFLDLRPAVLAARSGGASLPQDAYFTRAADGAAPMTCSSLTNRTFSAIRTRRTRTTRPATTGSCGRA